uniref:Uncharacterized protein n=1 Tax=Kalanchoe fedtschenkoi TaxID=63787 RepID=A0A7N0U248_KALFE
MVRVTNHMLVGHGWGSMPLAAGLFLSISALVALCAKNSRMKREAKPREEHRAVAASHISSPTKKGKRSKDRAGEGFGEGGLWQNNILMGEKCQPLEFSGAIFYDNSGNRVSEITRSPRASPMSAFSFPAVRESVA